MTGTGKAMGEPTWTPGPWKATLNNYDVDLRQWTIRDADGGYVADVRTPYVDYDMSVAHAADPNCRMPHDARLLAAAPDLFNVVRGLIGADQDDTWDTDRKWLRDAADAALRLATGEEK